LLVSCMASSSTLKMVVIYSSRMSGHLCTTRHYNTEVSIFIAVLRIGQEGVLEVASFLCGLLIYPEDGGNIFLQNIRPFPNYTLLQHRSLRIHRCVENGARGSYVSWIVVNVIC
jgi:hypothetical protein